MNLRVRKFVNYAETSVRVSKRHDHQSINPRTRTCSERPETSVEEVKQNNAPALKRRATINVNLSVNRNKRVRSVGKFESTEKSSQETAKSTRLLNAHSSRIGRNDSPLSKHQVPLVNRSRSRITKPKVEQISSVAQKTVIRRHSISSASTTKCESSVSSNAKKIQRSELVQNTKKPEIVPSVSLNTQINRTRETRTTADNTKAIDNREVFRANQVSLNRRRSNRTKSPSSELVCTTSRCSSRSRPPIVDDDVSNTVFEKPTRSRSVKQQRLAESNSKPSPAEATHQPFVKARSRSCARQNNPDVNVQKYESISKTPRSKNVSTLQKKCEKSAQQESQPLRPTTRSRTRIGQVEVRISQIKAKSEASESCNSSSGTVSRKRARSVIKTEKEKKNVRRISNNRKNCGFNNDVSDEEMGSSSDDQDDSESDALSDDEKQHASTKRSCKSKGFDDVDVDEYINGKLFERRYRELIPVHSSNPPTEFYEMQNIWSKLSSGMTHETLLNYKKGLIRLMTGRVSSLQPVREIFPDLPIPLEASHNRLYSLLCQCSGAYPFKNHEGSTLISQHKLADKSQIAAQILIESMDNELLPFDISKETNILTQIETYVRIGIKDMLQEMVEQLPKNRNKVTVADIKESLASRLLP